MSGSVAEERTGSKKRAAEDDIDSGEGANGTQHARKREKLETGSISKSDEAPSQKSVKQPFNAIPALPVAARPASQLFVWGSGGDGQFGLGPDTRGEIIRPRPHAWFEEASKLGKLGPDGAGLVRVIAGGMHTLAIDEEGKVWSFGVNDNGALGRITENVVDPTDNTRTLDADELETTPMVVQSLLDEGFKAVDIASSDSVGVVVGSEGQLRVWGSFKASDGLLGFDGKAGSPKIQFQPMSIPILANQRFVQVACGNDHALALTMQGHVWVWGNGQNGQLGRKIIERRKINGLAPERLALRRIKYIAAGNNTSFAIDQKGIVYAWGTNSSRQTGVERDEEVDQDIIWEPSEVAALNPKSLGLQRRVVEISPGEFHTLFRISDGSVFACGSCMDHELGFREDHPQMIQKREKDERYLKEKLEQWEKGVKKAEKTRRKSDPNQVSKQAADAQEKSNSMKKPTLVETGYIAKPSPIDFPCGDHIIGISAGTRHNLAVSSSGEVYSWGLGVSSQLGLGRDEETKKIVELAPLPQQVMSQKMKGWHVNRINAGGQHCACLATPP